MKRVFFLASRTARSNAIECISHCPDGYKVTVQEPTRSLEANAKMWALLQDVADQVVWHGQRLTKEEWKDAMTAALKKQKVIPGIDGGFVVLGSSTSRMSKSEMSDLIEFITVFGADRGVVWSDEARQLEPAR